MTSQDTTTQRNSMIGGIVLIVIGLFTLVAQITRSETLGLLILPALAAIFLAWGIMTRNAGLLVPAGILGGLGIGVLLITGALSALPGEAKGGVVVLSLGLGFVAVTLLSTIITNKKQAWALIPGAILALVGAALLAGGAGLQVLEFIGNLWPLVLIGIGVSIIFFGRAKS